ncbi:N-acyl homoserine lactonase family protein [Sphingomonas lutea]|uniref:N-acyl homoserine lactonase family protein n=1 Tax=Sphingomonas lutea TaxID=1045317 RepID=A0A7G9SJH7_9SPHN|nr:N-acyl homoserine lactonase family protein [Sphingomonas lutea]QNN68002.1 N-acyl homoserine lactonase family protein [Sphingomonas lutea]
MRKLLMAGLLAAAAAAAPAQAPQPDLELWRLDCGDFMMKKFGAWFSDTFQYPPGARPLVGSCYLIRHGDRYLLWDTGLSDELIAKPVDNDEQRMSLKRTLVDQLKVIGVAPEKIGFVGISHFHGDHTGQAKHFPNATLVIGQADWEVIKGDNPSVADARKHLDHWISGKGKAVPVGSDVDIFRDGSVTMLMLPGHTPGHSALLVRLKSGPVLLSGDQYHFTEAVKNRGVPVFNTNRADTLASHDRFDRIAANTSAKVIIQHEPSDVAKLPAFPTSAR